MLFDDFHTRASKVDGPLAGKIITVVLPIVGGPGSAKVVVDILGHGEVFRGRYSVSSLGARKVRSLFRKVTSDFRLRWNLSVGHAGLLMTTIAISAAADQEEGESSVRIGSIQIVMK